MTAEHLKGLLESKDDSSLLVELANSLAQADVPSDIARALRLGHITALQRNPTTGCGALLSESSFADWWRTLAKQQAKEATAPYQNALETCAGCECVIDLDDNATVVSVDGVGAFDLILRNSMFSGLMGTREGEQLLPLAKLFHGDPSTCLREDEVGDVHHIHQGEGGEQGDALMLFCFRQHGALRAIAASVARREVIRIFGRLVCGVQQGQENQETSR